MASEFDNWFLPLRGAPSPTAPAEEPTSLFCFPYSGMGVAMFASWRRHLRDGVQVFAARLPGREDKLREPARTALNPLAEELAEVIAGSQHTSRLALAGFSLGGLLAFEVARALRRRGLRRLELLAVGSAIAPHYEVSRSALHMLPEHEFLEQLDSRFGGVAWEVLEDQEMRRLVTPMLRSDIQMVETYRYQPGPPLDCEVLTLIGEDDHAVTYEQAIAWRELAHAHHHRGFPGDHFFARSQARAVVDVISERIRHRRALTRPSG